MLGHAVGGVPALPSPEYAEWCCDSRSQPAAQKHARTTFDYAARMPDELTFSVHPTPYALNSGLSTLNSKPYILESES